MKGKRDFLKFIGLKSKSSVLPEKAFEHLLVQKYTQYLS